MSVPTTDVWPDLSKKLGVEVSAAGTFRPSQARSADVSKALFGPCSDGERTDALLRIAGSMLGRNFDLEATISFCLIWNSRNTPPLPDEKVVSTCRSIAAKDARDHPDRRRAGLQPLDHEHEQLEPLFDLRTANVEGFLLTPGPRRRWIFEDFLPLGIVAALVAPGGTGKSQFLMQLAYAVTSGGPLAGHWNVSEPGSVLMLCAEDDREEIHRRIHRIHRKIGALADGAQVVRIVSRLFVQPMVGEDVLMTEVNRNNEAVRTSFVERLALTAASAPDLKLIIVDPGSRFRGGDENSNLHATRFVQALEALVQRTGATVIVAHHVSKASMFSISEPSQSASRGASALTDAVRLQLNLSAVPKAGSKGAGMTPEPPNKDLFLSVVKSNYTAPQLPVRLRREDDGYLQSVANDVDANLVDQMLQHKLLLLISRSKVALTAKKIEEHHCGPEKEIPASQKYARAMIEQMQIAGLIRWEARTPITLTPAGKKVIGKT